MRSAFGYLLSFALHAGLVASAYIYFPDAASRLQDSVIVPVDLVEIAPETNVRAARPEPEPEEDEPETEPEPVETEPEPEPVETTPESEPVPPAQPEESEPQPETIEEEPEPEPVEPEPVEEEPERRGLDLDRLSSLVDQAREQSSSRSNAEEGEARRGAGAGTDMTATMSDLFRSQASRCWREPADAPNPDALRVSVQVRLERSGELAEPPRLMDEARIRNARDPYLRIAGERALRAVIECAPYAMPAERYSQWRRITVNFDPSM